MKKGQIRQGTVIDVKFPNKGIVKLEPPCRGAADSGDEAGRKAASGGNAAGSEAEGDAASGGKAAGSQASRPDSEEYAVVKNVLPGQLLSVMIGKVRKGKGEGRALQVLKPSPDEIPAPCPHFGSCGGCTYLSLPYEKQLELKQRQVKELLDGALAGQEEAGCPWEFEPIKPSPMPFAYKNKMEFSFGDEEKNGPLALGMHKRGSFYDIVSVRDCRIVDGDYRRILNGVLDYFSARQVGFFHRLTHIGYLRHLLVRKAAGTGQILTALVTTTQTDTLPGEEKELLDGFVNTLNGLSLEGKITGILHICNDSVADVVRSDRTDILYGQDYFYEELLGLRFKVSVFSFFQTNSYGAEVLYTTARDYIGRLQKEKPVIYDLYSGTGTIAQMMAPVAGRVIGVEIVEEAVEAARENARLNGLDNCEFIAGDVLKVLDEIEEKPDFIILDPPRDGIHPKALQKILRYGVDRLLYISCKPTSLARDLEAFLDSGYVVEKAGCVDMFPGSGNVETVCLLSNRKPDTKVRIDVDLEDYYRIKDAKKNQN